MAVLILYNQGKLQGAFLDAKMGGQRKEAGIGFFPLGGARDNSESLGNGGCGRREGVRWRRELRL